MARLITVKSSRKEHTCSFCGRTIKPGESYSHMTFKTGPYSSLTRKRCTDHGPWKASQRTMNQYQVTYLSACEDFEDGDYSSAEDVAEALRTAAETIRENAETLKENAQSIEDGFGHSTYQSEELNDRADGWEQFCDDAEQVADDIESEEAVCSNCGLDEDGHDEGGLCPIDGSEGCTHCGMVQQDHIGGKCPDDSGQVFDPERQEAELAVDLDALVEQGSDALAESPE